jgi:Zn finger protein HypA/HybF involved in hydrogenase expression
MIRACLSIVAWLMMLLALVFARLPGRKEGDWEEEILKSIREKIRQLKAGEEATKELIETARTEIEELPKSAFVTCPHCGKPTRALVQTENLPQSLTVICRHCGKKLQIHVDAEKNILVRRAE